MVKTNYTKVEEAFEDGFRKATVNNLLDMTGKNTGGVEASAPTAAQRQLLFALKYELRHLEKQGQVPYDKLGVTKKELKQWMNNPSSLTSKDWQKIKQIKEQINEFKKELAEKTSSDEIVTIERNKHINKRFNVNDRWLPLK